MESYPFPMYSGIFDPKHYKRIGAALWFFSWCVKATTSETLDGEGVIWGHIHDGKPMKLSELAKPFGVNEKTVSRWIDSLEQHGYIKVIRAPYGLIISVKDSKKRLDKNVRSKQTNMSDLEQENGQICPITTERTDINVRSNKDIKDITTTTTDDGSIDDENVEPFIQVLNAYCKLHSKLDFHVKAKERTLMHRMIAGGMPVPFIIRVMQQVYAERSEETNITSFLYYESPIREAWRNEQSQTTPAESGTVAKGPVRQSVNRVENRNQAAMQKIKEAEERERKRSAQVVSGH